MIGYKLLSTCHQQAVVAFLAGHMTKPTTVWFMVNFLEGNGVCSFHQEDKFPFHFHYEPNKRNNRTRKRLLTKNQTIPRKITENVSEQVMRILLLNSTPFY